MIKKIIFLLYFLSPLFLVAQQLQQQLAVGVNKLAIDPQFKHAIISLYVVETKTGKLLYEKNGQVGLAPASCQKVITSATAFELLGKDYAYKTAIGYDGTIRDSILMGNLYIIGSGDPTLGSWRWKQTSEDYVMKKIKAELKKAGFRSWQNYVIDNSKWGTQTIPGGWVWEDIGNYYGAGCSAFNWHENQYDIVLKAGRNIGDPVEIISKNQPGMLTIINELTTAAKGTGDQAYVYCGPNSSIAYLRGTIPLGSDSFVITASASQPADLFEAKVKSGTKSSIIYVVDANNANNSFANSESNSATFKGKMEHTLFELTSPGLDSINYWFLKKSINLYGEAFVITIAYEKTHNGSTDTGISIIKDFWSKKGIEKSALNIIDGSGLSPANRVTTNALVQVMQYAKDQSWYPYFYQALPEMNGIKMKDGYIGGVRSYTGYVKSKSGNMYTFSFIVNNFDGSPGSVREKIWKVLDLLK